MIFETERLIIRHWQESDAQDVYHCCKDPLVGPAAGFPVHTSVENSRDIIRDILSAPSNYAVVLKKTGRVIGNFGFKFGDASRFVQSKDQCEIGYWLGQDYWGNGYIPEAVNKMLEYAFNTLGMNTIWCGYFDGNEKSKRVQEKCGFIYQRTEKDIPWAATNDIRTEHITRLTKEEWTQKNK